MIRHSNAEDRGSASAELALLTPVLILIAMLVLLAHRLVTAGMAADAAAHAAARAATLERTPAAARTAAQSAAAQAVRTHALSCAAYDLSVDTGGLAPGATVSVTFACHADLSDLVGLGVPGTRTVQGTAASVVDTYRSTP
ncbi:TadE/TadG family type IV pilus assembly protein [Nocardiopsis quinghaiensis]|uniref:TadE/TadG family type IV pilus assembly protein n=1 Tax=Nocardiopsis quinghaiensis TaxID=464995 RepID=UPI00123B95EE|nr:TadE/TadG family type IV pilus assembly protein [Nocardiopsis quinghaiensis]